MSFRSISLAAALFAVVSLSACGSTTPQLPDAGCEDCECVPGENATCYGGPTGTLGVGICSAGTRTCDEAGKWASCVSSVLPQAEICNGQDDDCDGAVDEEMPQATCGLGACQVTSDTCEDGHPVECEPLQPAVREACDGIDDDCDGTVDEDCSCTDGAMQPCYSGPMGTSGVGNCQPGTQLCSNGMWGSCTGETLPGLEVCNGADDDCDAATDESDPLIGAPCSTGLPGVCSNGLRECDLGVLICKQTGMAAAESCNGLDDNCDGQVDEGSPGAGKACQTGLNGVCAEGVTACQGEQPSCIPLSSPTPEVCDGLDNDCDGLIDDGNPGSGQPCSTGLPGPCASGTTACSNGTPSCAQTTQPTAETCNGVDDDCDGQTDDSPVGLGQTCTTTLPGACAAGTTTCSNGGVTCSALASPAAETCNGVDDDCDGSVDEGNPGGGASCSTGQPGVCATGVATCSGGVIACVASQQPSAELCDGLDNDCDGPSDEGNPGGGASCTSGQPGLCAAGTTSCSSGQLQCVPANSPQPETCNGVDDDCDGVVDDAPGGLGQACATGVPGACGAGSTTCTNGAITCQQTVMPTSETCNAIDDDCDGSVDEGNPGGGSACSTGLPGVCATGLTVCSNGAMTCQQSLQPSPETCDGQDNDCDGAADEGNPGGGASCNSGQPGICAAGTTACSGGQVQCVPASSPQTETCNNVDDDCDGAVDDGDPGGGFACSTGLQGVCGTGVTACLGGTTQCQQLTMPSAEVCDGKDNDCDGAVDEGNPGAGVACTTGLPGACNAGTTSCNGGVLVCTQDTLPVAETCNLQDDDCDGAVDEDFDFTKDPNNCGGCGNVCGTTAGALCCNSACVTPNASNCGACGQACATGMVILNEVMSNPNAVTDSQGEWFELYNPNSYDLDLRGFVVKDLGTDTHTITSTLPVIAPAGGYVVLGINANSGTNGGVPVQYQYSGVQLANGADELVITAFGNTEADRVVWTSSTFTPVGKTEELGTNKRSATANDNLANWCVATTGYGTGGDLGTPGVVNACSK